jgi:hypothetical protein
MLISHPHHDVTVDPTGADDGGMVAYCSFCGTEQFELPCEIDIDPADILADVEPADVLAIENNLFSLRVA